MRCATANSVKGQYRNQGAVLHAMPLPGTNIRALFDFLQENKGIPVILPPKKSLCSALTNLRDIWGLDIRHVGYGRRYMLVGEWFGRVYIDYIAERLEA